MPPKPASKTPATGGKGISGVMNIDARYGLRIHGPIPSTCLYRMTRASDIINLISIPTDVPKFDDAVADFKARARDARPGASWLGRLPLEILTIINAFLDATSIVRLLMSEPYLCAILLPILRRILIREVSPWAGHRLICVSLWTRDYLPPDLLTQDEREFIKDQNDPYQRDEVSTKYLFDLIPRNIDGPYDSWSSLDLKEEELAQLPKSIQDFLRSLMATKNLLNRESLTHIFPRDQEWVLRNLTSQEYVRAKAMESAWHPSLADDTESPYSKARGPLMPYPGLGEAILARICWCNHAHVYRYTKPTFMQGKWAGHRFEVCTMARHKSLAEGWTDVSDEIIGELRDLVSTPGR